ncbi:MAG: glycosyltransferase family 4 protein [Acidobacteria bacterium]|nr:glycosyltransferase family 4 protein [Acidobacteriota bacterium]
MRTVLVCEAQVPFVRGGAELCVSGLVHQLRRRGFEADRVSVPFKWYPKEELAAQAAAWRMVDLSEANGRPIDLVIPTKFPTYFVRHPNKVTWLLHQYRAIYELCGTAYSEFTHVEADVRLRDRLMQLDEGALGESKRLYTIAKNTSARLALYNGMAADPLYHPPPLAARMRPGPYGSYILSAGRLEPTKRVDLIIRAFAKTRPPLRLFVVGEGPLGPDLRALAESLGVHDRVTFTGRVDEHPLVDLYAEALAVVFPPYDEDYGYVTLEAFLARKPVITTTDAGGPLEFVEHEATGLVAAPDPESIAAAIERLASDRACAARLGDAGFERARAITWDAVIDRLVGDARA